MNGTWMYFDMGGKLADMFDRAGSSKPRSDIRWHEKLSALGFPHQLDPTTRAGGHSCAYFNFMAERAVRFVQQELEHESRRLL